MALDSLVHAVDPLIRSHIAGLQPNAADGDFPSMSSDPRPEPTAWSGDHGCEHLSWAVVFAADPLFWHSVHLCLGSLHVIVAGVAVHRLALQSLSRELRSANVADR